MAWWSLVWAILIGCVIISASGLAVALPLRLRGVWLAAATATIGISVVAVATLVADLLALPWSIWPVLAVAGVASVGAWLLARYIPMLRSLPPRPDVSRIAPLAGIGLGSLLLTARLVFAIGSADFFAQVGDNVFHLNAAKSIVDGGSASPLAFGGFGEAAAAIPIYPSAWHAITALIIQVSGVAVPVAANAVLFIVACAIWPIAAVTLTRTIFGGITPVLIAAGALSAGFAAYPLQLIPSLGTFPLIGSIPLMAIALAAVLEAGRIGQPRLGAGTAGVVLLLCLPGVAVMHPSALIMLAVLALPTVAGVAARFVQNGRATGRLAALVVVLAMAAVLALVVFARTAIVQPDSWRGTVAQSIGEYLLASLVGYSPSVVIAAVCVVGIVSAIARRTPGGLAAVAMWAIVGFLYVAAAGDDEFLRLLVSGPWYADANRVAAFAPVVALPLAALGAGLAWDWGSEIARNSRLLDSPTLRRLAASIAIVIACGVIVQDIGVRAVDRWAHSVFAPTGNPFGSLAALGADERAVIGRVQQLVPEGDLIAGNPFDGSSLAYALTGRPVLLAHLLEPVTPLKQTFLDGFGTATAEGPACRAAREREVKWILVFHPGDLMPNVPHYLGLQDLDDSLNVELAYRSGDSSLYQVTGCGIT